MTASAEHSVRSAVGRAARLMMHVVEFTHRVHPGSTKLAIGDAKRSREMDSRRQRIGQAIHGLSRHDQKSSVLAGPGRRRGAAEGALRKACECAVASAGKTTLLEVMSMSSQ